MKNNTTNFIARWIIFFILIGVHYSLISFIRFLTDGNIYNTMTCYTLGLLTVEMMNTNKGGNK